MREIDACLLKYRTTLHYTRASAATALTIPVVFAETGLPVDIGQCRADGVLQVKQVAAYQS